MTGHAQILKRCYSRLLETLQSIRVVNTQHGRPLPPQLSREGHQPQSEEGSEVAELGTSLLSWQGECGGKGQSPPCALPLSLEGLPVGIGEGGNALGRIWVSASWDIPVSLLPSPARAHLPEKPPGSAQPPGIGLCVPFLHLPSFSCSEAGMAPSSSYHLGMP